MQRHHRRPDLERGNAALLRLVHLYRVPGYRATRKEIRHLAYFLHISGEELGLRFTSGEFGPHADGLRTLLEPLDGHFLTGVGDGESRSEIRLADGAAEEADAFLADNADAADHLDDVASVIEGFETPYGMELLATVHGAATEEPGGVLDIDATVEAVHDWSPRKREIFREDHIRKVYRHLKAGGWLQRRALES